MPSDAAPPLSPPLEPAPYAVVAVALPLPKTYTYGVPEALLDVLEPGHAVLVPFGARMVSGFVIERTHTLAFDRSRLKPVERLLSPEPLFDPALLPFFRWTADYYHHPLGETIRTALPNGILIESQLMCVLTPQGKALLQQSPVESLPPEGTDPSLKSLLELLQLRGPQAWQRLLERPPIEGIAKRVRQAVREGWVRLEQVLSEATVKAQEVEVYRPGAPVAPRALKGELQQLVLEILQTLGEADADELREALTERGKKTSSLSSTLKRLLELELIEVETKERWRQGGAALTLEDTHFTPTKAQQAAVDAIEQAIEEATKARAYKTFALHGVTGSGKTEVYLSAVGSARARGRGAIVLVPEIALTPQLVGRFRARFGDEVACLHSAMSRGERFDAWRRLMRGEASIAVGARSALFAPVKDLALIIVDEEHDGSFKQDSGLRYNARDLAVVRAHQVGGVAVLGSATLSLETWANVRRHRFTLLSLPGRVENRAMPKVHLVDMTRPEHRPRLETSPLSPPLEEALQRTVGAGQQAILLLNRRGFAPFVICPGCGGSFRCLHCDISLTYHRKKNLLLCHYCGLTKRLPDACPNCSHSPLELMGQGTERLEHFLQELLPDTAVGRLDRDTTAGKEGHVRILEAFRRGELQVLVGTQMVVKGHDFPNVTLVGILNADYALNLPDFRASERTFQLVTQVSGRAGRGEMPGEVFVQTHTPHHPSIWCSAHHNGPEFLGLELRLRKAHGYPPFSRLCLIQISAQEEARVEEASHQIAQLLRTHTREALGEHPTLRELEVIGPAPAPLSRLQQWFRWQVLIKAPTVAPIHTLLRRVELLPEFQPTSLETRVVIDVDPMQLV